MCLGKQIDALMPWLQHKLRILFCLILTHLLFLVLLFFIFSENDVLPRLLIS